MQLLNPFVVDTVSFPSLIFQQSLCRQMLAVPFFNYQDYSIRNRRSKMAEQSSMLKYINVARQHPAYYISLIDKQLESFLNDKEIPINEDMIYETNEGKKAWKEARRFLQQQKALPPFQIHEGLNMSAREHAVDLAKHSMFGHTGSNKSTFSERILKYCKKGQGAMAQIIGADFYLQGRNHSEMTVLGLIVDDGVADRGHRKTIFNPQYRYIGCKSQIQKDKVITVFNMTENKLQVRGQSSTLSYDAQSYSNSTSSRLKKEEKADNFPQRVENTFSSPRDRSKSPFQEIASNIPSARFGSDPLQTPKASSEFQGSKKVSQRKQNTRIFYEDNSKTVQKHTVVYYSDGTRQQNIEKHTVYS